MMFTREPILTKAIAEVNIGIQWWLSTSYLNTSVINNCIIIPTPFFKKAMGILLKLPSFGHAISLITQRNSTKLATSLPLIVRVC